MASSKRSPRLLFAALAVLLTLGLPWLNGCSADTAGEETNAPSQNEGTAAIDGEGAPMTYAAYGEHIAAEGAVPVEDLTAHREDYLNETVKIAGPARSVCEKMGCWVILGDAPATVRVQVPRSDSGYVFTLPVDLSGQRIVAEGELTEETFDAETRAHYAEESGQTVAETPATELQLAARSVLVSETP